MRRSEFPTGGALLFAVFRLCTWLGVAVGAIVAFVGALGFSDFQGFSPDGPPPGFVRIPTPIFALLMFVPMLVMLSAHVPWVSAPIAAGLLVNLSWRFLLTREDRSAANVWLQRHTVLVIFAMTLIVGAYAGAAAYSHQRGPADLAIYNSSGIVLENVVFQTDSRSIPIGRLQLFERRFLQAQSSAQEEKVRIGFQANGKDHIAEFTGGIDNSRRYYFQFSIADDLRGHFGAWENRFRSQVTVVNNSGSTVSNMCLHGLGWQVRRSSLGHGQSASEWVISRGPMIFSIAFEVNGTRHGQELHRGWGYEGRFVTIGIPPDFKCLW